MPESKDGPFLALAKRCKCSRSLIVRPSLSWVNWMRTVTRKTGQEFGGRAFSYQCPGCGEITFIDAEDLYLEGVLEGAG